MELQQLSDGTRLRFIDETMQYCGEIRGELSTAPPVRISIAKRWVASEHGAQLSESVQAIGACCCQDNALAAAMLFPTQSLAYMESGGNVAGLSKASQIPGLYASLCSDPLSNLLVLEDSAIAELALPQASTFLSAFMARVPPIMRSCSRVSRLVSYSDDPIRVLAWHLESPARILLYTGATPPLPSQLDMPVFQPHTLPKVMLAEASKRGSVTVIHELRSSQVSASVSDDIRDSLSAYAGTKLAPFQETLSSSKGRGLQVQAHALEEGLACLVHPPSDDKHTQIPLNGSVAWTGHHIDARCAIAHHHSLHITLLHRFRCVEWSQPCVQ